MNISKFSAFRFFYQVQPGGRLVVWDACVWLVWHDNHVACIEIIES